MIIIIKRSPNSLTCIQCPAGWYQNSAHCYKIFQTQLNWYQAEASCKTFNASLLKIDDQSEYNIVYANVYMTQLGSGNLWVSILK